VSEDVLEGLADWVLELVGGRAEAEVTATGGRSALTRFANSHIHQNMAEDHLGVRLRLAVDGRLASAYTDRTDLDGLQRLVDTTFAAANLRPRDPGWPGLAPAAAITGSDHYDPGTHRAPPADRADVVRDFVEAGAGLSAAGYCSSAGYDVFFANSAGQRAAGRTSHATVDGIHRGKGAAGSGWQSSVRLSALDGAVAGATAAAKARDGVDPLELEPGAYQVVLEPPCVADLLDFLVGYGFSAKTHAEGRSVVRLGEAQFDPAVSLADDAGDDRALSLSFDAEGTPRRRLDLVRDGVPVNLLHDRRTAAAAGTDSTGHGTPGGESYGPSPSTLVLAAGGSGVDELIAGVDRGLLVTELWYTRILDPKTQVVTGLTRNGLFLIEAGEVTRPVANLRFTQSYADALAPGNVVAIGSDTRLRGTDAIVPSVHLASWHFTGGARG